MDNKKRVLFDYVEFLFNCVVVVFSFMFLDKRDYFSGTFEVYMEYTSLQIIHVIILAYAIISIPKFMSKS